MDDVTRRELDLMKGEIMHLAAETTALQATVVQLAKRIGALDPVLAIAISQSFHEAAKVAESFSRAKGEAAGPLPETLRIIKQLWTAARGGDKPRGRA
jgi:hypothetical protein